MDGRCQVVRNLAAACVRRKGIAKQKRHRRRQLSEWATQRASWGAGGPWLHQGAQAELQGLKEPPHITNIEGNKFQLIKHGLRKTYSLAIAVPVICQGMNLTFKRTHWHCTMAAGAASAAGVVSQHSSADFRPGGKEPHESLCCLVLTSHSVWCSSGHMLER